MSAQPTITAPPVAEATDPIPTQTPAEPAVVAEAPDPEPADDLDGLSLGELRRLAVAKGWSTASRANKARLKKILREHPDGPPAVVAAASRQDGQYTPPVINEPQPDLPTPAWQPDADPTDEEGADEDGDAPDLSPLAAACAAGTVALYRLRGTGTTRRLPWLTGAALETAEWYRLRVNQGATVRQVAEECLTSKPTVRRALNALALMEEITDGVHDDAYTEGVTEILFSGEDTDDETADEA
jgi:hypothetical protein